MVKYIFIIFLIIIFSVIFYIINKNIKNIYYNINEQADKYIENFMNN